MARQGNISQVTITGGTHAGAQAVLCPTSENTETFLRHLITEICKPVGAGRYFNYTTTAGVQRVDRQEITGITVTIS